MAEKKTENTPKNDRAPVIVKIPRERKDQEDKVVWVNDRRYVIKRGVAVEVPYPVFKVLEHEEKMIEKAYEFEEKVQK